MATVTLHSLDATRAFAARLAPLLADGDVVELHGAIGAGKTTFTSAVAQALGAHEPVRSPTYTVAHRYELPAGRSLVHLDCYRDSAELSAEAWGDLEPHFSLRGVACIEWPEPVRPWLADRRTWSIRFEAVSADARVATITLPDDVDVLDLLGGPVPPAVIPDMGGTAAATAVDAEAVRHDASPGGASDTPCVLAIDTSGAELVVAVTDETGALLAGRRERARAQTLLGYVDIALAEAGRTRAAVAHVVVGIGPGGFTGLRVGVAAARGIAIALGRPLHAIGSLRAQIDAWNLAAGDVVWSVLDARRGEYFAQEWEYRGDGELAVVGDARTIPAAAVPDLQGVVFDTGGPSPETLARAAAAAVRDAEGAAADPMTVLPSYVRDPDAQPPRPRLRLDALTHADLDPLLELEARCFETPWTRGMYESELERPAGDAVLLAARDLRGGARLVGAALAARIGDSWHVMNVLVDPPSRRRGIAVRLLDELLARTDALGAEEGWTLEVRDGNEAAIGLYESRGFVNQGRRPGYYADTGEDALIMWRTEPLAGDSVSAGATSTQTA